MRSLAIECHSLFAPCHAGGHGFESRTPRQLSSGSNRLAGCTRCVSRMSPSWPRTSRRRRERSSLNSASRIPRTQERPTPAGDPDQSLKHDGVAPFDAERHLACSVAVSAEKLAQLAGGERLPWAACRRRKSRARSSAPTRSGSKPAARQGPCLRDRALFVTREPRVRLCEWLSRIDYLHCDLFLLEEAVRQFVHSEVLRPGTQELLHLDLGPAEFLDDVAEGAPVHPGLV